MSDQIYLIEKSAENIIWFSAKSEIGKFEDHFIMRAKELEKLNIPIKSGYLKYISGNVLINAHIGFGVPFNIKTSELTEVELVEQTAPCICIAIPFVDPIANIQSGYQKLMKYAVAHEWVPTGSIFEWYRGDNFTDLDLLMPVTQNEKRRER